MRSHCTISCHLHEISRLISAAQCDLCMKSHARRHGFSRYTCYMHMHMLASDISCPEAHTHHSGTAHPRPHRQYTVRSVQTARNMDMDMEARAQTMRHARDGAEEASWKCEITSGIAEITRSLIVSKCPLYTRAGTFC